MRNRKICLLREDKKILDAVKVIDSSDAKIAVIVDENDVLKGTVTDYDVRKAVLKGSSMDAAVTTIMNSAPKFVAYNSSPDQLRIAFEHNNVRQLPLVDEDHRVIDTALLQDYLERKKRRSNPVLLMAGGLGTRLRPLTDDCPKPLLKLGVKPILQIIMESFIDEGFDDFYISVNYKAEMIKDYFGDGRDFGVKITYIEENKRLGTAGALSLLPSTINEPVIVMNGDLLTKVDFHQLLDFHYNRHGQATMCVREYSYQIPYGVVEFDGWNITELREKPTHTAFVNAGIYVISPEMIASVPQNEYYDMTDLFNKMIDNGESALIFPVREYWMDIGRLEDFMKAKEEYL